MSVLPATPAVLSGVDAVLLALTRDAVGTTVAVTTGPLDRPVAGTRLNWFLYRIAPAVALMNMESPQTGWTTRPGRPPLALTLHYLLSADPGELTPVGNEMAAAHAALTATMMVLHERPVLSPDTVVSAAPRLTVADVTAELDGLVEPLRITMDPVPLETVTGLWGAGTKSLRVSVAYQVSLVTVASPVPFAPGPRVQEAVASVTPSVGPHVGGVTPATLSFGRPATVLVTGLGETIEVTLSRSTGDPDDPTDGRPDPATTHSTGPWHLTAVPTPDGLRVEVPNRLLVPGRRVVTVTTIANGLPAGADSGPVTVAPAVLSAPGPLRSGQSVVLDVAHALPAGRVGFGGLAVPYTPVTPSAVLQVSVAVPSGVATYAGRTVAASLESGTVSGPPTPLAVAG